MRGKTLKEVFFEEFEREQEIEMSEKVRRSKMRMILEHVPNADIPGGYWSPERIGRGDRQIVTVSDFGEASNVARGYIESQQLGGGNWTSEAGKILDDDGNVIARVSYNGRIVAR